MKKYEIEIDGQVYQVKVRELPDDAEMTEKAVPEQKAAVNGDGEKIVAPMSGTILRVMVEPGETVKAGDHLVILEAMKMENEIIAPKDGTVTSVNVQKGSTVESGALLVTLD